MDKKPSKFTNSSFHGVKDEPELRVNTGKKSKDSEFIQELVETGQANWKKAPKAVKTRYRGIFWVLFSIPILVFPSVELYRRLEGNSSKKVRKGEVLEGRTTRNYDEREKWETEKNSLMYKIFGRDFFLEGFTSKTMQSDNEAPTKSGKYINTKEN